MDRLWAPWRSKYIYLRKAPKCIFCGAKTEKDCRKKYIVSRSTYAFSILNLYPYNNGHVMVAPYRHVKSLETLSDAEIMDLMKLVNSTKAALDKILKPHGFNIGMNVGRVAGAGFAGHIHIHVVPRWKGDTNFMTVVSGSKIVSESLDAMYTQLKRHAGRIC